MPVIAPPLAISSEDLHTLGQWSRSGSIRAALVERAKAVLDSSECGAFLLFDFYNIRYTTQTWIGGALGFGWAGRNTFVIVPQALRRLLPPLVGLLVNIIQNTTIAAAIGATELLESGKRQVERLTAPPPAGLAEIHSFEIYGAVMLIFFCISFPLTLLARYLERRLV
jgi:hypothetical protein